MLGNVLKQEVFLRADSRDSFEMDFPQQTAFHPILLPRMI
jgi:hypothetical protein